MGRENDDVELFVEVVGVDVDDIITRFYFSIALDFFERKKRHFRTRVLFRAASFDSSMKNTCLSDGIYYALILDSTKF